MHLVQVQLFGIGIKYGLQILHQYEKRVKLKVRKILGLIPTFVEVTGNKLVGWKGGRGCGIPFILNRVKVIQPTQQVFTSSKATMKMVEKSVKYVQSY